MNKSSPEISIDINNRLKPGDLGTIVHLHGTIYADEYGFDTTFEPYVAIPLSELVLNKSTEEQRIWIARGDDKIVGTIAIVEGTDSLAQLRWLLVQPEYRGNGLGKMLVRKALKFASETGYSGVFLWTVSILHAAKHIYKIHQFRKTEEKTHRIWGRLLTEERYELTF